MFCKKCGNVLGTDLVCQSCGYKNELDEGLYNIQEKEIVQSEENIVERLNDEKPVVKECIKESVVRNKIWAWLSGMMFLVSIIPLYKGYDKITHYYCSESFSSLNKNAYVGGDAYNYIINAGYATAFWVLAVGAALLGVGFLIVYYLSGKKVN